MLSKEMLKVFKQDFSMHVLKQSPLLEEHLHYDIMYNLSD